jgi:hypothetical protein
MAMPRLGLRSLRYCVGDATQSAEICSSRSRWDDYFLSGWRCQDRTRSLRLLSRLLPLAKTLQESPPGKLIEANSYYAFSSVFFYTGASALLLNGRNDNLEYGSNAPGAPQVFIDDNQFVSLWSG